MIFFSIEIKYFISNQLKLGIWMQIMDKVQIDTSAFLHYMVWSIMKALTLVES